MRKFIKVKVITSSPKERVKEEPNFLKAYLTTPKEKGKANKRLIEVLSNFLGLKKSSLKIARGRNSSNKLIEIVDETNL